MQNLLVQLKESIKQNALDRRFVLFAPFLLAIGIIVGIEHFLAYDFRIIGAICLALCIVNIAIWRVSIVRDSGFLAVIATIFSIFVCFVFGVFLINYKSQLVSAPIIPAKGIYSQISGEIKNINRTNFGKWRVLLKAHSIKGLSAMQTPFYIRLNVETIDPLSTGAILTCDGFLAPPSGQILPDEYDFAMKLWFSKIGTVGACQNDPLISKSEVTRIRPSIINLLIQWRNAAAFNITNGEIGGGRGLLAALMTGNRSYLSQSENNALQVSGLGHIVSVSGLHVGLLAAIVFFPLRKILVCVPNLALYSDTRKIAAIFTMAILAFYTFLTGAEPPALRALIMAGVAFFGLIFDRRAISMRALAISALVLLAIMPEQAIDAGFQMSFFATMALVALWEWFDKNRDMRPKTLIEKIAFWPIAAGLTSLCAGTATIPMSLFSFESTNTYGLVANLAAAPISDFLIAPFAALGAIFSALGFGEIFLNIAAWGSEILLRIAAFFASLPQANFNLGEFSPFCFFTTSFAIIWYCILVGKMRNLAIIPLVLGFGVWVTNPKPALYISAYGKAILRPPSKGKDAKLCFGANAGYEARLLLNAVKLSSEEKARLLAIAGKRANPCAINDGDFEVHFIALSPENPPENPNAKTAQNSLLSITFGAQTYSLGNNAPIGAKIYRINNMPILKIGRESTAPWRKNSQLSINNDDKARQERLEP